MALQLRQVNSDKTLGLFWTGSTLSTVGKAKTYTSFRSAAKDQALVSIANGIQLEIVDSVTTQTDANTQTSVRLAVLNSSSSINTVSSKQAMIVSNTSQAFTNTQT
jgi:hypothetical protein